MPEAGSSREGQQKVHTAWEMLKYGQMGNQTTILPILGRREIITPIVAMLLKVFGIQQKLRNRQRNRKV
jgi:hypothetical protein